MLAGTWYEDPNIKRLRKMIELIELYDWVCWKFGTFEYRLCGYNDRDGQVKCIITEPILGVNVENQFVETTNNLKFKLHEPIKKKDMMDMVYILDKWMSINIKGNPSNATEMMLEALGRNKDGKEIQREEDVPLQTAPSKVKSNEGAKRGRKSTKDSNPQEQA